VSHTVLKLTFNKESNAPENESPLLTTPQWRMALT